MRLRLLAASILVVTVAGVAAAADAQLVNPGFETGTLEGWDYYIPYGGTLQVVSTSTWHDPIEGSYFALLKTDGPGSYTRVWQTIDVAAGDVISGWAFFKTNDYPPYTDNGSVRVLDAETSSVVATLYYEDTVGVGGFGYSDWTWFEYTFETAGTYVFEARVSNYGDSGYDSYIALDGVTLEAGTIEVAVDVKPDSDENKVNLKSGGVIPVAVFGTDDLDVTEIDVSTVAFGPDGAAETHGKGHYEDVDGDGITDLVLHFRVQDTGLTKDDETVTLTGFLESGAAFAGSDAITVK